MKTLVKIAVLSTALVPAAALAGGEPDVRNLMQPYQHWFAEAPLTIDSEDIASVDGEDDIIVAAAQTWNDVACTDMNFVDDGRGNVSSVTSDGVSAVIFNGGCESGVLAYNVRFTDAGNQHSHNERIWREITETDTVFCSWVDWGAPSDIDEPGCSGEFDLQGVALHEFGHGIGYDHTCEADEACSDILLRSSVMYWSVGACDGAQRLPNEYDLETHSISYGLGASSNFLVTNGQGGVPLDVTFTPQVVASASILSIVWEFGDGSTETTTGPVTHEYVTEGRFSVGARITANSPSCGGEFEQNVRKLSAVVACNEVEPAFTWDRDGKTVHFYSKTQGAAAGCLQTLNWDFGDGATSNVKNPIHKYSTGGTYNVTLTASGPAGTSEPLIREVKVGDEGGGGLFGCSVDGAPSTNSAAAAGMLGIAVAMSLATFRRRRSS